MTTKRRLAEQVQKILYPRLGKDVKFSLREAMLAVSQVRDNIAYSLLTSAAFDGDYDLFGGFVSEYEFVAEKNSKGVFVQLPVAPLDLPKGMGVYRISLTESPDKVFIPLPINFLSMYAEDEMLSLEGNRGYIFQGNRLLFPKGDEGMCLSALMIVSGDSIDPDAYFPMPPSYERQVIMGAVEMYTLQKQVGEDLLNDNISE